MKMNGHWIIMDNSYFFLVGNEDRMTIYGILKTTTNIIVICLVFHTRKATESVTDCCRCFD